MQGARDSRSARPRIARSLPSRSLPSRSLSPPLGAPASTDADEAGHFHMVGEAFGADGVELVRRNTRARRTCTSRGGGCVRHTG